MKTKYFIFLIIGIVFISGCAVEEIPEELSKDLKAGKVS